MKSKNKINVRKIAFYGMMIALALVFSYLETFIPISALVGIPGVKLGLANIVVLFALYTMKLRDAFIIAVIRILIAGFLFGNPMTIAYSLAGGMLSLVVMWLLKKTKLSIIGVSMVGGICHNIGQLVVASIVTETPRIAYLLSMLLISGLITGLLMGIVANLVIDRLNKIKKKM